jgi:hypothetical protein
VDFGGLAIPAEGESKGTRRKSRLSEQAACCVQYKAAMTKKLRVKVEQ